MKKIIHSYFEIEILIIRVHMDALGSKGLRGTSNFSWTIIMMHYTIIIDAVLIGNFLLSFLISRLIMGQRFLYIHSMSWKVEKIAFFLHFYVPLPYEFSLKIRANACFSFRIGCRYLIQTNMQVTAYYLRIPSYKS